MDCATVLVFSYSQMFMENIVSHPHLRGWNTRFNMYFSAGNFLHLEIQDATLYWKHFRQQRGCGEGSGERRGHVLGASGISISSWYVI